jgi:plasmid stabilization system protein ParE
MTLRIQPKAETDMVDAYWYYEARSPGLGERFDEELNTCFDLIQRHPRA